MSNTSAILKKHNIPPEAEAMPGNYLPLPGRTLRTQKARGMKAIGLKDDIIVAQTLVELIVAWLFVARRGKVFCRPCPKWPRPGFWDSRVCNTLQEAIDLWNGMMGVEPEGEMIVMPFTESVFSTCWTPGLLALGPKNDGATAGISSSAVPLCEWKPTGSVDETVRNSISNSGVYDADEDRRHPHLELVFNSDKPIGYSQRHAPGQLVQIRAGHKAVGAGDWVPHTVAVAEVKDAPVGNAVDLMTEFEEWAVNNRGRKDLVVWAPGSSQGSHTALHCKANGIAFVCEGDQRPEVGNEIPPTTENKPPCPKATAQSFVAGLTVPLTDAYDYKSAVRLMLVLAHGYQPDGVHAKWVGAAAALMLRLGMAAGLGEFRYYRGSVVTKPTMVKNAGSRDEVYEKAFPSYFQSRKLLDDAFTAYGDPDPCAWSGGYGGKAWFNCIQATMQLEASVVTMLRDQSPESVNDLLIKLNNCINQAHNGGWFLSKYADESEQDFAAAGSFNQVRQTMPLLWRLINCENSNSHQKVTAVVNRALKIVEHDLLWLEMPKPKPGADDWKKELNDKLFACHYTSEPAANKRALLDECRFRWRVVDGTTIRVQAAFNKVSNYMEFDVSLIQSQFEKLINTILSQDQVKSWSSDAVYNRAVPFSPGGKRMTFCGVTINTPSAGSIATYDGAGPNND
jgi:hypothetical protein